MSALAPVGLVGALGVLIVAEIEAPGYAAGLMVGAFFLAGAAFITCFGPVIDWLGWRRSAMLGIGLTGLALAGCASVAQRWQVLVAWLAIAGIGSSITQTSSSVMLSSVVRPSRRGFAMSMKFAAVPTALLLAGLAVPALGESIGWRASFGLFVAVPLVALVGLSGVQHGESPRQRPRERNAGSVRRGLVVAGVSMFLASMLPGALLGFIVPAMVDVGLALGAAGAVFAGLNVLSILSRVTVAWLADTPAFDGYRAVAAMMVLGGLGTGLLALADRWAVLLGAAFAFVFGWGWTGQSFFLAVRAYPDNPGAAASVIQSGGMFGSAAGPFASAAAAHAWGLAAGWLPIAAASLTAGLLLLRWSPRIKGEEAT